MSRPAGRTAHRVAACPTERVRGIDRPPRTLPTLPRCRPGSEPVLTPRKGLCPSSAPPTPPHLRCGARVLPLRREGGRSCRDALHRTTVPGGPGRVAGLPQRCRPAARGTCAGFAGRAASNGLGTAAAMCAARIICSGAQVAADVTHQMDADLTLGEPPLLVTTRETVTVAPCGHGLRGKIGQRLEHRDVRTRGRGSRLVVDIDSDVGRDVVGSGSSRRADTCRSPKHWQVKHPAFTRRSHDRPPAGAGGACRWGRP